MHIIPGHFRALREGLWVDFGVQHREWQERMLQRGKECCLKEEHSSGSSSSALAYVPASARPSLQRSRARVGECARDGSEG